MKVIIIDGTPEEMAKFEPLLAAMSLARPVEPQIADATELRGVVSKVTADQALDVLSRRTLDANPRKVLKVLLAHGGVEQDGITTKEIAEKVGLTTRQLSGVFGAFGSRVKHTPGWPEGLDFLEFTYDDNGVGRYWLRPVVRQILEEGLFVL
jgi:hypothetical protein